jgi:hypothetical protein
MKDTVTHWSVTGTDGFGGFTFAAPTLLSGRWEEKAELFKDLDNEEHVSKAIVYVSEAVEIGDYLALGDHVTVPVADPTSLTLGSFRIMQRNRSTDLRALKSIRKVFL